MFEKKRIRKWPREKTLFMSSQMMLIFVEFLKGLLEDRK
jgi:hypothetical protein